MENLKNIAPIEDFNWDAYEKGEAVTSMSQEELEKAYDGTLNKVNDREVVDGTVISMNKREVVVNIGYKSDGIIPLNEFRYNPDLKVGDTVEVYIENQEDKKGQLILSHKKATINRIYDIVNRSGVQMLIFLAGLQSISPAIYESVQIDGATAWETFWKITFPMITPMILVNAVYTIIDSFTTNTNTVMTFIENVYSSRTGGNVLSSAMSWIYFLIVILIIAAVAGIMSMFVFYQRRD
jgi:hypothetical protein